MRIDRLAAGNPGDVKAIGSGISELRIDHGPGDRVYHLREGNRGCDHRGQGRRAANAERAGVRRVPVGVGLPVFRTLASPECRPAADLHRELFAGTEIPAGRFKESHNLVVDRSPDGSVVVRFVPVPAANTEYFTAELIDRYRDAVAEGRHHPVLLVGSFVLDLLTIHPFADGNGRVVRALTNALLDDAGYRVGRYVSLEQLIAESADDYHAALLASTHGWHDRENDPWPWLSYFVETLSRLPTVRAASRIGPVEPDEAGPCPGVRVGAPATDLQDR